MEFQRQIEEADTALKGRVISWNSVFVLPVPNKTDEPLA